jgi:hypothetical protein
MIADHKLARLAGLLFLILWPTSAVSYLTGRMAAAGGADWVESHRTMFELAIVLGAAGFIDFLVLAMVLYRLLQPYGPFAARLMVAFVGVSVPVALVALAREIDILFLLDGGQPTGALAAPVAAALKSYNNLLLVSAIFWGLWLLPLGLLTLRSGVIPRLLGILLIAGSPFYVMAFAGTVFDSGYETSMLGRVVGILSGIPDLAGELGTGLWLLIRGAGKRQPEAPAGAV